MHAQFAVAVLAIFENLYFTR